MTQATPSSLDADAQEKAKTREQKAEDIAYTVNHAISCGTTDIFVQPFVSAAVVTAIQSNKLPRWLHWLENIFEKHDHGHHSDGHAHAHNHANAHSHHEHNAACGHTHGHDHSAPAKKQSLWKQLLHNAQHWLFGEVVGDVGGILPTIWVQRTFPGFMHGIRRVLEPVAGGVFRNGAERDARHWGQKHGFDADSNEVKQKAAALYEHEVSHLPQAVVWNAFSIPINYAAQVGMALYRKQPVPNWKEFAVGKTFGFLISNGVLLGGRAIAPEKFNEWDRINSQHVIEPTMRKIGGILGIDHKTVDKIAKENASLRGDTWQAREQKRAEEAGQATETSRAV